MMLRVFTGLALLAAAVCADDIGREAAIESYLADADDHTYMAPGLDDKDAMRERWVGDAGLGFSLTRATQDSVNLSYNVETKRIVKKWTFHILFTGVYAEQDNLESANEHILVGRADYELDAKSSVFVSLLLEYDAQEALSLRVRPLAGYSRQLTDKAKFKLWGDAAAGLRYENFFGNIPTETQGIAMLGVRWIWQLTDKVLYEQVIQIEPSLSNFGEYRFIWISKFTVPIAERFKLNVIIRDTYNSQAVPPTKKNQFIMSIVLAYTW